MHELLLCSVHLQAATPTAMTLIITSLRGPLVSGNVITFGIIPSLNPGTVLPSANRLTARMNGSLPAAIPGTSATTLVIRSPRRPTSTDITLAAAYVSAWPSSLLQVFGSQGLVVDVEVRLPVPGGSANVTLTANTGFVYGSTVPGQAFGPTNPETSASTTYASPLAFSGAAAGSTVPFARFTLQAAPRGPLPTVAADVAARAAVAGVSLSAAQVAALSQTPTLTLPASTQAQVQATGSSSLVPAGLFSASYTSAYSAAAITAALAQSRALASAYTFDTIAPANTSFLLRLPAGTATGPDGAAAPVNAVELWVSVPYRQTARAVRSGATWFSASFPLATTTGTLDIALVGAEALQGICTDVSSALQIATGKVRWP